MRLSMIGMLVVVGCWGCAGSRGATLSSAELRIATDALFPPFHFLADDQQVTGYDLELLRAALEHIGYAHRTQVVRPYGQLFAGLDNGSHDLVAATTGITPERQQKYLFTQPYFETCQAVMVRRGSGRPRTLSDLAGRRVGAAGSGTSARALHRLVGITRVSFAGAAAALEALRSGDIDGFVVDEFEAVAFAREDPDHLMVLMQPAALEQYGFVMSKDRRALQRQLNQALDALQADGTTDRLRRRFNVHRDADWPVHLPQAGR